MDTTLWNIAFSGQAKTSRCKFCFSLSHESDDCDWAPTPKGRSSSSILSKTRPTSTTSVSNRCCTWNYNQLCPYGAQCRYQHVCLLCGANHKITTCSLQKGKHRNQQQLTPNQYLYQPPTQQQQQRYPPNQPPAQQQQQRYHPY